MKKIMFFLIKYFVNIHFIIFLGMTYLFFMINKVNFDAKYKLISLLVIFIGITNAVHHWYNIK
jgi:hypothetical protein